MVKNEVPDDVRVAAGELLSQKAAARAKEKNIPYGRALAEIAVEKPDLVIPSKEMPGSQPAKKVV